MLNKGSYKEVNVASSADLLNYANALPKVCRPEWWLFRGTGKKYSLQTSLERALSCAGIDLGEAPDLERKMLKEFKRRAQFYADALPSDGDVLGWFALMQHHGAPTRLLDWTYSFFVAAFFALSDASTVPEEDHCKPPVVWAIYRDAFSLSSQAPVAARAYECASGQGDWQQDVSRCDGDAIYDGINAFLLSVMGTPERCIWAVNAFRLHERLSVQKGVFLCPGDITRTFEDNMTERVSRQNLVCFKFSACKHARAKMLATLDTMNITNNSLFPGLDGFARSLWQTAWVRYRLRPEKASHA